MDPKSDFDKLCYPMRGSIKMDINVMEYLHTPVFSNLVKIGKAEWKMKVRLTAEETIQAHLIFVCKQDNEEMTARYAFRLVHPSDSQKSLLLNGPEFHARSNTGSQINRGLLKIIGWGEMWQKGFVKDDIIRLEAYVTVVSETFLRRTIDYTAKRPNHQDLKVIFPEPEKVEPRPGFVLDSININKMTEKTFSGLFRVSGVPCRTSYQCRLIDGEWWVTVFAYINSDDKSDWWSVLASIGFSMKTDDEYADTALWSPTIANSRVNVYGMEKFMKWDELVNPKNGYVKNGWCTLKSNILIVEKVGFDEKTGKGIDKPIEWFTNVALNVDGQVLHLAKELLAAQSRYFDNLFKSDPNRQEFDVPGTSIVDFTQFLNLVHNQDVHVDEKRLESLLLTIQHFQAPEIFERLDVILKQYSVNDPTRLRPLVNKFPLPALKSRVLSLSEQSREAEIEEYAFSTDFDEKRIDCDLTLNVDGYEYHLNKKVMANSSEKIFKGSYGPSSNVTEVVLLNAIPLQSEKMLTHIYHPSRPITKANFEQLIQLANNLKATRLIDKCEEFLVLRESVTLAIKCGYAKAFQLPFLTELALKQLEEKRILDDKWIELLEELKFYQ